MKKYKGQNTKSNKSSSANNLNQKDFIVVGLGASAGGVKALQDFFKGMPADSGMAFVVILHLSPQFESNLASILQTQTKMPVIQVTDFEKVEPNKVYVISPHQQLLMIDGTIQATEIEKKNGVRVAIDLFFRSLGDAYETRAVGILLSGTGEDGTLGIKRIKENNGFVIVQQPEDTEFDSMSRSAIATDLVDWILPVAEMPQKLITFRETTKKMHLLSPDDEKVADEIKGREALRDVLTLLRVRTGHDFANYKQATLIRRIARHLQIHELEDLPTYLQFLHEHPEELQSLLKNLLINVTSFFRDKEAFEVLEKRIVPELFLGKTSNDAIRVWVAGCASGEEAFSMAMLLSEYAAKMKDPPKIQIFGTDIDDEAIAEAREHRYTEAITADVSPERLRRFFTRDGNSYLVKKELREMILFAPHNVLRDPPFSRLDLVTCRNLLIYLNRETQERVLQVFHFALRQGGYLFLGNSETADALTSLYAQVDKKHKIYAYRSNPAQSSKLPPLLPIQGQWQINTSEYRAAPKNESMASFGELHYKLIEKYAPPSVLINDDYDLIHLSESAGKFLQFSGGEPTNNIFKIIHPDLLADLRTAIYTTQNEHRPAEFQNVRIKLNGVEAFVNLIVRSVQIPEVGRDFLLVIFDESLIKSVNTQYKEKKAHAISSDDALNTLVRALEEDLRRTKDRLRSTIEQHETSVEELKASNEELQAINEELRSAGEELETSKEELQAVNEELVTVNLEAKEKLDELGRSNADLQNFMASTDIATIFLDRAFQIKRYTPPAQKLFNIMPSDIGRPLEHFTHNLNDENLTNDAEEVLRTLMPIEREIDSKEQRYYIARFSPYRTLEDRIDGVVLTFIDITGRKQTERSLHASEERLRLIIESAKDYAIFTTDLDFRVSSWNSGAQAIFGYFESEIIGKAGDILFTPEDRAAGIPQREAERATKNGRAENERWHFRKDASRFYGSGLTMPLRNETGTIIGFVIIMRDLTESKQSEQFLRESEERLGSIIDSAEDYAIMTLDTNGYFSAWNKGARKLFGYSPEEVIGQPAKIIFTPEDVAQGVHLKEIETARREGRAADERFHLRKDGSRFYVSGVMMRLDGGNEKYSFAKIARDLTERQQMEETLKDTARRKDEFLATLAHELRNPLAPIRSGLEIIRDATNNKASRMEALETIERQTNQIVNLVDDLLDVSRITHGKINLKKRRIDLSKAVRMAVETVKRQIDLAEHKLEIVLPANPVYLFADLTRISQILGNLLSNSSKYSEPGSKILVTVKIKDGLAVIRVKDTGIGIRAELMPYIFQLFTQADTASNKARGGLGVGLSVVKKLVELHSGTVEAFSVGEGQGSEFIVRLPLDPNQVTKADNALPISKESPNPPAPAKRKPKVANLKILVVDDNTDAVEMLRILLSMEGHEVRTALSGEKGLEQAKVFQPDVCLLDIGLPEMSGYEFARHLRQMMPDVFLISISGWGQDEDRRRSEQAGINHHLVKPVEFDDIKKLLPIKN